MIGDREHWLARTLIELADTLADDFDLVELLTRLVERCREVLDAADVGIMLADGNGSLQVLATTSEGIRLLELLEVQDEEGPCRDAYRTGTAIRNAPVDDPRWPTFAARAEAEGYRLVHALPLRHGGRTIGAVNIFHTDHTTPAAADLDIAQSLADIATIAILHNRALNQALNVAGQLQRALQSRVAVEQAKGVLAERLGVDIDVAFQLLRGYSRSHNDHIADVARHILDGALPAERLLDEARAQPRRLRRQGARGDT